MQRIAAPVIFPSTARHEGVFTKEIVMKKFVLASVSALALFTVAACSDSADTTTTQSVPPVEEPMAPQAEPNATPAPEVNPAPEADPAPLQPAPAPAPAQ